MSKLSIAEAFFSIQGEGRYSGTPAVFVRVAGCNLSCGAVGRDLAEVNPTEDDPVEGASWLCVSGDTLIPTEEKKIKMEDVEVGDRVYTRKYNTAKQVGLDKVIRKESKGVQKVLKLEVGGREVRATPDHEFYTHIDGTDRRLKKKELQNFEVGEKIQVVPNSLETCEFEQIDSIEADGEVEVYDIETEKSKRFVADGVVTKNCDTIDVWRKPDNVYSTEEFIEELRARGWIENLLQKDAHFVLTGGEPTMPNHQEAWTDFMNRFEAVFGETPFVEVETNGTFVFTKDFLETVDHVNCSLKLSNSGHSIDDRIKPEAIGQLKIFDQTQSPVTFDWKFVVSGQDDIEEVNDLVTSFNMENVILMPAGLSREQLKETYPRAIEFAKERGWKVTGREHITAWDKQTGV